MQGRKEIQPKMMYQVTLDQLVPKDNFYRKLDTTLNLRFLYKATARFYGSEGQESIDPLVFFKICLIGYLNNINSDRKLLEYCNNCLDIRLYLKYDIDEPLPWHSTISRTRQLYGEEVFLELFRKVLSMCVHQGMVSGKRQAVDSALIKANASLDSLVEKEVAADAELWASELNEGSEYKVSQTMKKVVERHHEWKKQAYKDKPGGENISGHSNRIDTPTDENGNLIRPRFLSNHTHYSPTDPDARIAVKPGKARQMNYYGQLSVDTAHHVVTGAMADFADKRDSQCLPAILGQAKDNLQAEGIQIEQVLADAAYSSGSSLKYLENNDIEGYIPNFGQYRSEREGFEYNATEDRYECQRGNRALLPFKGERTDSKGYTKKTYRSSEKDCNGCPFQTECCGPKTRFKKIDDSIDKPYYDRMKARLDADPAYAKRMSRIRSKTVEPVLGTLINFTNMRRIHTRGIHSATKCVLMAATVYNLKKYLKWVNQKAKREAAAMRAEAYLVQNSLQSALNGLKYGCRHKLIF